MCFYVGSICVGVHTHKRFLPKGTCVNVVDPMRT